MAMIGLYHVGARTGLAIRLLRYLLPARQASMTSL